MSSADYLPISGLQHLAYCERQCALIHVERVWVENHLTAEGKVLHERAHDPGVTAMGRVIRSMELRTDRLRLVGRADIVELVGESNPSVPWPRPVEYKRGRTTNRIADRIQLCAQAFALEELFSCSIPAGHIYYAASKRRAEVVFDDGLRALTERLARRFHELIENQELPPADMAPKCRNCSLQAPCQPRKPNTPSASDYLQSIFRDLVSDPAGDASQ